MSAEMLAAARARALCASGISLIAAPDRATAEAAIRESMRRNGYTSGCVARVAWDFGDHPAATAVRMARAVRIVADLYGRREEVAS